MSGTVENGSIVRLERIDARIEPYDWAYARENAAAIAAHWARISAGKPAMFNGRIMLQHRAAIRGGVFEAGYFETDYAAFMTWRDAGHPGLFIADRQGGDRSARPAAAGDVARQPLGAPRPGAGGALLCRRGRGAVRLGRMALSAPGSAGRRRRPEGIGSRPSWRGAGSDTG